MKKVIHLLIATALLLCSTAAFAQNKVEISAALSPYALQDFNYNGAGYSAVCSQYGLGAKAEGRYFITDLLYTGANMSFETFDLGSNYSSWYSNIKFMPEIGIKYDFNDQFYALASLDPGLVLGIYNGGVKVYFGTEVVAGCGYNINDNWAVEATLSGCWHIQPHSNADLTSNVFGFDTFIGVKYKI